MIPLQNKQITMRGNQQLKPNQLTSNQKRNNCSHIQLPIVINILIEFSCLEIMPIAKQQLNKFQLNDSKRWVSFLCVNYPSNKTFKQVLPRGACTNSLSSKILQIEKQQQLFQTKDK